MAVISHARLSVILTSAGQFRVRSSVRASQPYDLALGPADATKRYQSTDRSDWQDACFRQFPSTREYVTIPRYSIRVAQG